MSPLTYKKAGVDIDKADAFIKKIKPLLEKTERSGCIGKIGGFGGFFRPDTAGMSDPLLVASTDGVGTKLILAEQQQKYDTIGIDLVAMCVNDVVVSGAEPLFFLDYIACGKLDPEQLADVVKGIAAACREAGCALIGGETAELPGMYEEGKMDLAGFCVGMVSGDRVVDGAGCQEGDRIIGLASSGVHSNGFSLVRKIFSEEELRGPKGKELLTPTRLYVQPVLKVIKEVRLKAIAHITGGGFIDNIPRVLPDGLDALIRKGIWPVPDVFHEIQKRGNLPESEMFRTFNMGVGMAVICSEEDSEAVLESFKTCGMSCWDIGRLVSGKSGEKKVRLIQ
jgi:phosphoribosylformylglycinamidine cyclo-ligase